MFEYMNEVFRAYDIRGKYPEQISEEFAERLGKTVGTLYNKITVGIDTRESSKLLKETLIKGINSTGTDVVYVDVSPNDMVTLGGEVFDSDLNIVITASHLPKDKNGFKLFKKNGAAFVEKEWNPIKEMFIKGEFKQGEGKVEDGHDKLKEYYLNKVETQFKKFFDKLDVKIVVDEGGGALLAAPLLKKFGAEVISINDTERESEPLPTTLTKLIETVKRENADLGVASDTDADRFAAVDSEGNYIDPNTLIMLFADLTVKRGEKAVVPMDVSNTCFEHFKRKNVESVITKVGYPFITDEMVKQNINFGAEQSSHYFYLPLSPCSSGTFFSLLIAGIGKQLPEKLKQYPKVKMIKHRQYEGYEDKWEKMNEIGTVVKDKYEIISDIDGFKFKPNESVAATIRPSNTEKVIKLNVESEDEQQNEIWMQQLKKEFFG